MSSKLFFQIGISNEVAYVHWISSAERGTELFHLLSTISMWPIQVFAHAYVKREVSTWILNLDKKSVWSGKGPNEVKSTQISLFVLSCLFPLTTDDWFGFIGSWIARGAIVQVSEYLSKSSDVVKIESVKRTVTSYVGMKLLHGDEKTLWHRSNFLVAHNISWRVCNDHDHEWGIENVCVTLVSTFKLVSR